MELLATVVSTDYELKVLLLKALAEPEEREVWEKYLALAIQTAVDELPRRVGSEYRDAGSVFKEALQPMKNDVGFMQDLGAIRDRVASHHDLVNGDNWQAQWHLTAIANKRGTLGADEQVGCSRVDSAHGAECLGPSPHGEAP